eukprot:m.181040 g.181040  ORF g.181040 m.181040 type:complete len:1325 (-) comp14955_c0_seq1:125-4099(-)
MAAIVVAVRARPPRSALKKDDVPFLAFGDDGRTISIAGPGRSQNYTFSFDYTLDSRGDTAAPGSGSQEAVFSAVGKGVVQHAFDGYNATVFAYGQTGSGKSYTMMGLHEPPEQAGLIPRLCRAIFEGVETRAAADADLRFEVNCSYMEIYNERVFDLLDPTGGRDKALSVRESKSSGPFVEGLIELAVDSFKTVEHLIQQGNTLRHVASTAMNATSSRSHAVFELIVKQISTVKGIDVARVSRINLVDLAGSERQKKSKASGALLKEGAAINKSLSTLGLVISALVKLQTKKEPVKHVPYRSSILTWLLRESFGGNAKTVMVATISADPENYEEVLSTLRYAACTKQLRNKAVVNESERDKAVRELKNHISVLEAELTDAVERGENFEAIVELKQSAEAQEKLLKKEITCRKVQLAFTKAVMAKTKADLASNKAKLLEVMRSEHNSQLCIEEQERQLEALRASEGASKECVANLSSTMEEISAQHSRDQHQHAEYITEVQLKIATLEEDRDRLQKALSEAESAHAAAKMEITAMAQRAAESESTLALLKTEVATRRQELKIAEASLQDSKSRHNEEEKALHMGLEDLAETQRSLLEANAAVETLQADIAKRNADVNEWRARCDEAVNARSQLETLLRKQEKSSDEGRLQLEKATNEVADLEGEVKTLNLEIQSVQHQLFESRVTHQAYQKELAAKQDQLDATRAQLEDAHGSIRELRLEMVTRSENIEQAQRMHEAAIASDEERLTHLQAALDKTTVELHETNATVAELRQEISSRDEMVADTTLRLKEAKNARDNQKEILQAKQVEVDEAVIRMKEATSSVAALRQELVAREEATEQVIQRFGDEEAERVAANQELMAKFEAAKRELVSAEEAVQRLHEDVSAKDALLSQAQNHLKSVMIEYDAMKCQYEAKQVELQGALGQLGHVNTCISELRMKITTQDAAVEQSRIRLAEVTAAAEGNCRLLSDTQRELKATRVRLDESEDTIVHLRTDLADCEKTVIQEKAKAERAIAEHSATREKLQDEKLDILNRLEAAEATNRSLKQEFKGSRASERAPLAESSPANETLLRNTNQGMFVGAASHAYSADQKLARATDFQRRSCDLEVATARPSISTVEKSTNLCVKEEQDKLRAVKSERDMIQADELGRAVTTISELESRVATCETDRGDLQSELEKERAKREASQKQIISLRDEVQKKESIIASLRRTLHDHDDLLAKSQIQIDESLPLLNSRRNAMDAHLASVESERTALAMKLAEAEAERDTSRRELLKTQQQMVCTEETIAQVRQDAEREVAAAKALEKRKEAELQDNYLFFCPRTTCSIV